MADSLAIRPKETLSSPSSHSSADSQFQKVTLWYTSKRAKEVASIINSVDRRAYVGEFSFSDQEPNNVPVYTYPYHSDDLYKQVSRTLHRVSLLHNLKVLHCSLPLVSHKYLSDHDLDEEFDRYRGEIVKSLVIGTADRPAERDATPRELKKLEIVNLPCRPQRDLTDHPSFSALLSTLQTLVLRFDYASTREEPYRYSPLGDVSHEFFTDLPQAWLEPASTGLTSLTLGANELWGYLLKVNFRRVRFPHLKSLDMQRFVFSHDWQLEWILSHKSLQKLSLYQCPILTHARWYGEMKDDYPTKFSSIGDRRSLQEHHHAKSWHHYYEEFLGGLKNLRSFTLVPDGQSTKKYPIGLYALYEKFYEDRWFKVTPFPRTQAEDEEAFNLLQATISSRPGQ